ncbi:MAG: HdeD family acid-resistance protein [Actinomycetota bacterium]
MNDLFARSWWILGAHGAIAVAFGVLAILWPGITLLALVALFAAYALVSGVVYVTGALRYRQADNDWWLLLLIGLIGIGASVIAVLHPDLTALVLVLLMGANALVVGMLEIVSAIRLRRLIRNEWLMILSGAVSILFGILVFLFPAAGALAMIWLISLYAVLTGALLLGLAFRLRKLVQPGAGRDERRITPDRRISPAHS